MQKGDKLAIICKSDADWWWARKGQSIGYVPTNHITSLSDGEGGWQDGEYFSSYNTMVSATLKGMHCLFNKEPKKQSLLAKTSGPYVCVLTVITS